ncbi:MAG: N-acetyl-gamma-glutamyl-phosphate reductase [Acidobacteriota bacterium]
MRSIGLLGGRGYTGEALLSLLENHPDLEVAWVASRSLAGQRVRDAFPGLSLDHAFQSLPPGPLPPSDVVVLALPNGVASSYLAELPQEQRVLDLSADYRFDEAWVYGLPEWNRAEIRRATRIANPGCYATAAQLALAPLRDRLSAAAPPVVYGVSGYSGAGRTPHPRNDPERLRNNLLPYALTGHVHEKEVSDRLGTDVRFTPHVASFFRGISATVSALLEKPTSSDALLGLYREAYRGEPLIEVSPSIPEVAHVASSPRAAIGGFAVDERDPRRVTLVACLDNLLKGAASQALQNINLMLDLPERAGLSGAPEPS